MYIWGEAMAHLFGTLLYKPEGSGLFRLHYGSGVDSDSNRNECPEYILGGGVGDAAGA